MELEERKVLYPRRPWHVWTQRDKKEWWYTGACDPDRQLYVSWNVIRVNFIDRVSVMIFDAERNEPDHFSKKLFLDEDQPPRELSLNHSGSDLEFHYNGSGQHGWQFEFSGGGISANLDIQPTIRHFTKFDNTLSKNYGLVHFFQNRANGKVETGDGRIYELHDALVYYDHCFGTVPSQTGWHWLAVQNTQVALASLVNYGPHAQRYSQVWFGSGTSCPQSRQDQWVRLEQSVSFEQETADDFEDPWHVTSSDLDLTVAPLPRQHHTTDEHIPPMTRFLVDLHHTEVFVRVTGSVRVDGLWVPLDEPLYGVMEQHYGRW